MNPQSHHTSSHCTKFPLPVPHLVRRHVLLSSWRRTREINSFRVLLSYFYDYACLVVEAYVSYFGTYFLPLNFDILKVFLACHAFNF
jgi:hypothetical protein